ncbi:MAG: helix-turn-helix domain-containing protein [Thermoproteales archaeon]|nr:helix-turn-helix domain-containing protein [Thermoproteales archaeon]
MNVKNNYKEIDEEPLIKELIVKIAGDIIISPNPGKSMRKWRELFRISQIELANAMKVSASVISDYESGRRKSPGSRFIKKFVYSLIYKDIERGGQITSGLFKILLGSDKLKEAVLDMKEFSEPIRMENFLRIIDAELLVGENVLNNYIFGYTVVDSIKLVLDVPSYDYVRLYGATTQRAAIFTKVYYGRSPLVAVKAMQAGMGGLRPAIIILHGLRKIDQLGLLIAQKEGIPLAVSKIEDVEELIERLRKID